MMRKSVVTIVAAEPLAGSSFFSRVPIHHPFSHVRLFKGARTISGS